MDNLWAILAAVGVAAVPLVINWVVDRRYGHKREVQHRARLEGRDKAIEVLLDDHKSLLKELDPLALADRLKERARKLREREHGASEPG